MPISEKIRRADITINNSEGLKELKKQVIQKTIPGIYSILGYFDYHI